MYDRRIRDIVRYESGEAIGDFHVPTTVDDYRAVYRAYLQTGSISALGLVEALEHRLGTDHPLRPLFLVDRPGTAKPYASVNLLLRHGVRSCLEPPRPGT
jgi:hypothetical protein